MYMWIVCDVVCWPTYHPHGSLSGVVAVAHVLLLSRHRPLAIVVVSHLGRLKAGAVAAAIAAAIAFAFAYICLRYCK